MNNEIYSILSRPRFGENGCWFYGDMEILLYFYRKLMHYLPKECITISKAEKVFCNIIDFDIIYLLTFLRSLIFTFFYTYLVPKRTL